MRTGARTTAHISVAFRGTYQVVYNFTGNPHVHASRLVVLCGIAEFRQKKIIIWSGTYQMVYNFTGNPHVHASRLVVLCGIAEFRQKKIIIIW
jgi:hypothetical protein